ncbi:universal stress protein [Luteibacter sp. SG786]|uniref:universal stress protein n=1 Tax=Luteibacter sp. SG786 TaxID=2587130 RepID=UPI00141DF322|nr:universal stress protein [Luteibacter sp. SG786]NII54992.1 nucleotide-binding universal stress UspA family protein [Luteibacter sp. SG786]
MNENMFPQNPDDALDWHTLGEPARKHEADPLTRFRDIAVVVAHLPGDTLAITCAGGLARRAGGHLHVLQMLAMPVEAPDAWALVPDPALVERYAELRAKAARQARDMQHRLSAMCVQGDVLTLEALCSAPPAMAAAAARRADLAVIGRPATSPSDASIAHAYFAGVLLESGRPVLVVPEGTSARMPPRRAVVGWSDTPEATRAAHDALPLLESAEAVDIVVVNAPKEPVEAVEQSVEGLLTHLRHHGVRTELTLCSSGRSPVSRMLLEQAHRKQAQLIVVGGYGHGRMREWALGGTTRELFHDSPIPVLFSH